MKLSKFIQVKIFSRLMILYLVTILSFLCISFYGFQKEIDRYFLISSGYISTSTQQLINEGDIIRTQMNIDHFTNQLNENAAFKICPKVYLDSVLIASVNCFGHMTKKNISYFTLNNSKKLIIELEIEYDYFIISLILKIIVFSFFSLIALLFIKRSIDKFAIEIITPLNKWSDWAKKLSFDKDVRLPEFSDSELNIYEFKNFNDFTKKTFELQKDYYLFKISAAKSKAAADLAKQVSHDIRSPLVALKMATEEIESIPDVHRSTINSTIQRINDIANNLLKPIKENTTQENPPLTIELLAPIIETIILEKRIQYRNKYNIEINLDLLEGQGLFSRINSVEFSRVISNLINNSIEAIDDFGKITVKLSENDNKILLTVSDSGKGMSLDILSKLGTPGFSHGKTGAESGNGLGISHAKKTIENFMGKFEISSIEGNGTIINITLPKSTTPYWFVSKMNLSPTKLFFDFVYIDDENIMRIGWESKAKKNNINLLTLKSSSEFALYLDQIDKNHTQIYIDSDLGPGEMRGEDFSAILHQQGYKNIFIASGHPAENFVHLSWLKYAGKICPF